MSISQKVLQAVWSRNVVHSPLLPRALAAQVCCSAKRRLFEQGDAPQSQVERPHELPDDNQTTETMPSSRPSRRAGLPKPSLNLRSNARKFVKPAVSIKYIGDTTPDPTTGFIGVAHLQPGVTFHKSCKIHVFHDLDNLKPEDVVPEYLIEEIQRVLNQFGDVTTYTAYGNEATWRWESPLEIQSRQLSKQLARAEHNLVRQGGRSKSNASAYRCDFCGRRCKSAVDLQKHFDQLHGREMKKKMARKPLAKRTLANKEYMERYNNARDAAHGKTRNVLKLEQCMKNIGVKVRKTKVLPEAVDQLIQEDIKHLLSSHVHQVTHEDEQPFKHAVCIISDDRDFETLLAEAKQHGWGCIAVCSEQVLDNRWRTALHSDFEVQRNRPSADVTRPRLFSELEEAQTIKKGAGEPGITNKQAKQLAADVTRVLQSGNRAGGTWDLAAVQLASKPSMTQRLIPIGGSYPEAHMTLDFQAMRALALERSKEAIGMEESEADEDDFDDGDVDMVLVTGDPSWDDIADGFMSPDEFYWDFIGGSDSVHEGSATPRRQPKRKGGGKKRKQN